jgi:peroxiredoxin
VDPCVPGTGWGVLHGLYTIDRARLADEPGLAKRVEDAVSALEADGHQVICFAVLGHKAEFGVVAVGPDLARLHQFQQELRAAPLVPVFGYVSLTEHSEYTSTEADERARLAAQGVAGAPLDDALEQWRARMETYLEHRLHPQLPTRRFVCFYPMSKRREGADNWYALSFDERRHFMQGHARVGRTYAGRVVQLITGSTGLDDWEWGVTLFADDPLAIKEIVYEMRFDEVSARFAEFGPFFTGLVGAPAEVLASVLASS